MEVIEMKQSVPIDSEIMISHRKLKCWSQSRLAQVSGVGERTIQRIENESKASYQNAQAIAGALELSLEELMSKKSKDSNAESTFLYDLIINKKAKFYQQVVSGSDLINLAGSAGAFSFNEGHLKNEEEVAAVASLIQNVRDWGDIYGDIEPGARVEAGFQLSKELRDVEQFGLLVFFHVQKMVSKLEGKPDFKFNHLSILLVRKDAPEITTNNVGKLLIAVVDDREKQIGLS